MKSCVLISAGQLAEEDKLLISELLGQEEAIAAKGSASLLRKGKKPYLVAVDGGADYCRELGLEPDLYLGDFDSVSAAEKEHIGQSIERDTKAEVLKLPTEKDDTDTLAALKIGMDRGYTEFHIFGGLGGRLDHTIANIQCLLYLKRKGGNGYLYQGNTKLFVLKNESVSFEGKGTGQKGLLSLFTLGDTAQGVTIKGMKYELENGTLNNDFPIGISNEFTEEAGSVSVEDGEVLVIVQ